MYSTLKNNFLKMKQSQLMISVTGALLALVIALLPASVVNTDSHVNATKLEQIEQNDLIQKSVEASTKVPSQLTSAVINEIKPRLLAIAQQETATAEVVPAVTSTASTTAQPVTYAPATSYTYSTGTLSNGNSAGEIGSAAAAKMAAATGVPQSTWEYIIARESNGNPNVANASGASGLFQTMPGWGSTATVDDQINSAINAYNAQGLSAWGMQ